MSTASSSIIEHANVRLALETERFADIMAHDNARRAAQVRADDAARMMAAREQARADADLRREYQARYADAFASHGTLVPAPVDDERPGQYRQRLFDSLQRKIASVSRTGDRQVRRPFLRPVAPEL
jgi:hypothetical protein